MQGEELKALRMHAELTQAELGEMLGVSTTFVGLMERGEAPVSDRTENMISALLKTRIDLSYSDAVGKWVVALTRPGKPPVGREHYLVAAKPTLEEARAVADNLLTENPFATKVERLAGGRSSDSRVEIFKRSDGMWTWRLLAGNGEMLARGESYHDKRDCVHAVTVTKSIFIGLGGGTLGIKTIVE